MAPDVMYIEDADAKLDELSQKILITLNKEDEPVPAAAIANSLAERRQSVWYRLHNHLTQAGYVTSTDETSGWYESDGPYWMLSANGEMFVQVRHDELARPKSLESMSREIYRARKEAESAKESVQNYRKKVQRIKDETDALESHLNEIRERDAISPHNQLEAHELIATQVRQDIEAEISILEAKIGDLDTLRLHDCSTVAEALEKIIRVLNTHHRGLENQSGQLDSIEQEIENVRAALVVTDEEVSELDKRLSEEEASWL